MSASTTTLLQHLDFMYLTHLRGRPHIHAQNPSQHVPTILTNPDQYAHIANATKARRTAHPPFSPVWELCLWGFVFVVLCACTILVIQNKRDVVMFTCFTIILSIIVHIFSIFIL